MKLGLPDAQTLSSLLGAARALPDVAAQGATLDRLLSDYERGLAAEDRSLVVALVGATGAGKSTLLNALVGAPIAQSGEMRPTTATPVVYAPEDALTGSLGTEAGKVVRYSPYAPGPWSGQVFVDTPDLNSVAAAHRERARAVLELSDVALVVLHKGSVAEAVQVEFLASFARRRRLLFVLNHADLLSASSRDELKAQVARLAAERLSLPDAPVFAVSALQWVSGGAQVGERDGLLAALRALGERATADRIRRSNAVGALRELQQRVRPALEAADEASVRRAQLLAEGLGGARVTLSEDFAARLRTASAHLGHAVRKEAARRFWGPAGWWMRMTLAGTSGLGAAALLVRGNPLVAGGIAAGSALLSRVQEATLERGAQKRVHGDGLSDESTLSAARNATVAARAAAGSDGLDARLAGLPDVEEVSEALARARAQAWEATANLGLAEAVGRWWKVARFILLPLVNLPLLALFVHVGYRVVRGYLEGQYVGTDFLLNALALAGVVAGVGAGLASLSLAGVRHRLVSDGRRRFEAQLAELSSAWVQRAREGGSDAREAARRLVGLAPEVPVSEA